MSAVRRRHRDAENDEWKSIKSSLVEPLLGDDNGNVESPSNSQIQTCSGRDEPDRSKIQRHREVIAWHRIFSDLVAQWTAWFGQMLKGAGSMVAALGGTVAGMLASHVQLRLPAPPLTMTAQQEEHLHLLHQRLCVPYDSSNEEHQDALKALWRAAYPDQTLKAMVSDQWKNMGWQGTDPSTDFRGGGFISLQNLLHFAYRYPRSFRRLLNKEEGKRAEWEYPFAVAGLNITFMLILLLDLRSPVPSTKAGMKFVSLLGDDEKAFDDLYCVAFEMLDKRWLAMHASYMEFNVVMEAVRKELDALLSLETTESVSDLPLYVDLA